MRNAIGKFLAKLIPKIDGDTPVPCSDTALHLGRWRAFRWRDGAVLEHDTAANPNHGCTMIQASIDDAVPSAEVNGGRDAVPCR